MADIDLHRAHDLGLEKARAMAEKMAGDLGRKFGLQGDWDGNVLRFARPGLSGSLAVTAKDVRLSVTLGLLMKAMKASIERAVEQEIDGVFSKAAAQPEAKPKKPPSPPRKGG
jgi:putative polyhydroxyalkanoate system protein